MIYKKEEIELLSQALSNNKRAIIQLESECKELAMLQHALLGEIEAIKWLFKNNKILAAFDDAIGGNKTAVKFLIGQKEYGWAAIANYIHGDDAALEWLNKQGYSHLVRLAYSIKKMLEREQGKDVSFLFKP